MRHPVTRYAIAAAMLLVACVRRPVNTIPPLMPPLAEVQRLELELPPDVDVKAIDFAATTYADVRGFEGTTSSEVAGRAFIKVWAVHRTTGDNYLLLYEDIGHRRRPIQIIRFVRGADRVSPDSAR